jgi:hypothetical protein
MGLESSGSDIHMNWPERCSGSFEASSGSEDSIVTARQGRRIHCANMHVWLNAATRAITSGADPRGFDTSKKKHQSTFLKQDGG